MREAHTIAPDSSAIFQEGLYLSSPEFWKEFQKRGQLSDKEKNKADLSYAKYWLRSCSRCTPYGTFAGSAMIGVTGESSSLVLQDRGRHRRSLRLDMNYIAGIVHALVGMPEVRDQIKFFPNNSIYPTPDGYRYAEYSIRDNVRIYHLASVEKTPYIAALLARAAGGATINELSGALMAIESVSEEESSGFIMDLWQSQLLVAGLEPAVTGKEPLEQLIDHLATFQRPPALLAGLKEIQYQLSHPQEGVNFYRQVEERLQQLDLNLTVPRNTLQADLFLAMENGHLDKELVSAIIGQAEELQALSFQSKNGDLEDFKTKFLARYEDAAIPLSTALDADLGIGYAGSKDETAGGGPFIDGLPVGIPAGQNNGSPFGHVQQFTLRKYNDWATGDKEAIIILEEELKELARHVENHRLPCSMHLMGSLLQQDGRLDANHFIFDLAGMGGPSGANLLGRFTHGDPALSQYVMDILKAEEEEHPDALYAEIAHLSQSRAGNITLRPVLRRYEIPYVGLSGAEEHHQLPVDDLMVYVRNNQVILYSRKYNKRVIPRLTTAHNYNVMSLPVYKFLCDLQGQGLAHPMAWDWGHLTFLKYLPRVIYKNLIIHKALWKIGKQDIADLPAATEELPAFFLAFRQKLKLPEKVVYKEGDNELLIDFTHDQGIGLFLHYLKRNVTIQVEEFLFTDENCVVHDVHGAPYTNEFIIPVYREATDRSLVTGDNRRPREAPLSTPNEVAKKIQRDFSPYSEWLYCKIYCGAKTAEHILSAVILPFIEDGLENRLFERFFFIRYRDATGWHIRIRFFNKDTDRQLLVYKKLMQVLQPLMDSDAIDKVMLDTYRRELERYTPSLMESAETLFHNDSLTVLRFIHMLDGIDGEQYRLLFGMRGIDALLDDFGLSLQHKAALLKELQAGFFKEFGGHPSLQKQLNERYRKNQKWIAGHMDERKDDENEIGEAATLFSIRAEMNRPVVREIFSLTNTRDKPEKLYDLLTSYIHLYMNRLFIAQQRKYELVVYHFLEKYYASRIAITKKEQKDAVPAL